MERSYWKRNNLYDTTLIDVTNSDTADFIVDIEFNTKGKICGRSTEIDTAEIHCVAEDSEEYDRGMEQKQFVKDLLSGAERLMFRSEEDAAGYNERSHTRLKPLVMAKEDSDGELETSTLTDYGGLKRCLIGGSTRRTTDRYD